MRVCIIVVYMYRTCVFDSCAVVHYYIIHSIYPILYTQVLVPNTKARTSSLLFPHSASATYLPLYLLTYLLKRLLNRQRLSTTILSRNKLEIRG